MQKVYEKLLAHPLFIRDYVVYYARVARTFILVSLLCVCVTLLFGSAKQKLLKVEIFGLYDKSVLILETFCFM